MNLKRVYADIAKVEPQEDGTLKVYGYASSGAVDSDGEVITPDAMKTALPDYMKFGAVREMHQPIAAGTALEARVEEDGKTYFAAHVVDPIAVKKVTTGTYKGFSIGGKVLKRDGEDSKKIVGLKLVEVSLVDRPANPEAVFTCYKAETEKEDEPPAETAEVVDAKKAAVNELADLLTKGELSPAEVLALATAELDRRTKPAVAKINPVEMKKGMYQLKQFCDLLQGISWLTQDTEAEAQWEADNSPLPAGLRDWLSQGVRLFNEMTVEETAELLQSIAPAKSLAEKAEGIEKKGARYSKSTKKMLGEIHAMMNDCSKKMGELGYEAAEECDDDEDPKDKPKESAEQPTIQKADTDGDLLKAAIAERDNQFAKLSAAVDELRKQVKHLEDQPAPAKGVTRVIDKAADSDDLQKKEAPVVKIDGEVNEVASLIKASHANGPVTIQRIGMTVPKI